MIQLIETININSTIYSIKQEEDMLRYLFWKDPTNPLLRRFEKSLVIDVFADNRFLSLLNSQHLAPTDQVRKTKVFCRFWRKIS